MSFFYLQNPFERGYFRVQAGAAGVFLGRQVRAAKVEGPGVSDSG